MTAYLVEPIAPLGLTGYIIKGSPTYGFATAKLTNLLLSSGCTSSIEQFTYVTEKHEDIISFDYDNPHCHIELEHFEITYLHYV